MAIRRAQVKTMRKIAALAVQIAGLAFLLWSAQPIKLVLPWPALAILAVVYLFGVRFLANLVYPPAHKPVAQV